MRLPNRAKPVVRYTSRAAAGVNPSTTFGRGNSNCAAKIAACGENPVCLKGLMGDGCNGYKPLDMHIPNIPIPDSPFSDFYNTW